VADRIDVPLELEDFEVTSSEVVDGVLEVTVASTSRAACHHCGSVAVRGHGRNERRIRDRACAYPTVLRWSQRRFRCIDCGRTSRERHPELAGRKAVTNRFRRRLFERATREPFSHVARGERVSTYRVLEAFDSLASQELATVPLVPPRALSLDESAFRRRFRYSTVVSDPERGVVIDLFEGRSRTGVAAWLGRLSPQVREGIETVVMDLFWPYRRAVEAALPRARIVADKFHVLRAISQAAQRVRRRFSRRSYQQRLGRDGGSSRQHHPASDPELFRARWVFMKRASRLTETEASWLDDLFERTEPEVRAAWLLKESFAAIYEARDRAEAERRLDTWIHNLPAAGLTEFTNVWRTLSWWREQILAYFDDPLTNGFAEGITNKIKVMKRSAYGFRSPQRYRRKVLLSTSHRDWWAGSSHRSSR
jgi:transposase